jgi:hypothetical protein
MVKRKTAVVDELTERPAKPYFEIELRELWLNGVLVKRLDCRATNQILILTVFQEENWPSRIDDPLSPTNGRDGKDRLRSTIHSLNTCQNASVIHFFADGTGRGIRWEPIRSSVTASRNARRQSAYGGQGSHGRR